MNGTAMVSVLLCAGLVSVAGAPSIEQIAANFHRALEPAMHALEENNLPEARRLAPVVVQAFDAISPPALQIGQVAGLQRLAGRRDAAEALVERAQAIRARQ